MQIEIIVLCLVYGNDVVKGWFNMKCWQMINIKNLVFDLMEMVDEVMYVNMYDGFDVVLRKGWCQKIFELFKYFCNNDEVMFFWVLKWIVYLFQYLGVKMVMVIIMYGDEGLGKNLFWEKVVCQIYGQYFWVIGDVELESFFNEWVLCKLFLVCDEVVMCNELKQLKGWMKKMILGDELLINLKNLFVWYEVNYMNFVFFFNELQLFVLDKIDCCYLVFWMLFKCEKDFYVDVGREFDDGGMEVFFYYLKYEVDFDGFIFYIELIMNQVKQNLISLGFLLLECFYCEWEEQVLLVFFMICSLQQLYSVFQ